jgi:PEP-CTERM motif
MKILHALGMFSAAALACSTPALAGPAWEFTSAGNSYNNNDWVFATAFSVTNTLTATGLGYYADPSSGDVDSNPVALYKCDTAGCFTTGTLLASVIVDNTYPLTGHFRYVTINPLTLDPGDYLVSGVSFGDNYTWNDPGFATDPNIIVPSSATRWELDSGAGSPDFLNYVNTGEIEPDGFWGPNVFFGAPTFTGGVPEPAAWGMMVLGFGVIGGAMRTRRKAALAAA